MWIWFKAIFSRFKPFYYLCRVIAHTTKDKTNHWFSISYEYSPNVNYFNYKLSRYCLLISCFHSNKFVSYACVCVYVCVRMCVCTLALVCAYLCACAYRVGVRSISRKNIDCTFYSILCNFLFIALNYCTYKAILCNK